ncbi:hypothetical protein IPG41_04025 [Candidatus Peregrinibacteria bacterium]|nr:MAG: hypothetical protein IPG41_04025 [Candidatus Peregrinibacteria bacterium]
MNKSFSSKVLLLLSSCLIFAGCMQKVSLEIPGLGISVLAPEGAVVEMVNEGGFEIYRVSSDGGTLADLELHEGYDFDMEKLATVEGVKEVLDTWGFSYTVVEEEVGPYGAGVYYETADTFGVLAGFKNGETEVVCQPTSSETPTFSIQVVMDLCMSMAPMGQENEVE